MTAVFVVMFARTSAASPGLEIVGDTCDLSALEAEITHLVPAQSFSATRVRVETVQESNAFVANVWFPDGVAGRRGPRVVSAATCVQLIESIALVIAMALPDVLSDADERPSITDEEQPAPSLTIAEGAASTVRATETAVVRAVALQPARRTSLDIYAAGGGGFGANGVRGLLLVGARASRGVRSLSLQLRGDAPEERQVTMLGSVRVLRAELSMSPCLHLGSIAGCGVASAGIIRGQGVGLQTPRSATTPLLSAGLRVTWEHGLAGPIKARAYIEAQVLLTATQFEVDYMPVWRSERFEGSGGFGLLARFL